MGRVIVRAKKNRQRGFTLVEVLVAFAIFAMSAGALFEVLAGASRRAEEARERELLSLSAQSVLSELRLRDAPWPSDVEGRGSLGETWRVSVQPFETNTSPASQWRAYIVTVEVSSSRGGRSVTLQSVELARSPT